MIESKGWNWDMEFEGKESVWKNPSLESYGLMNRWGVQGKKKFLDLGCGLGRHAMLFGKNGFSVSCFDISQEALDCTKSWAESENLTFDYQCGEMRSLPYNENSFDCILGWNVINHTDTEGVKAVISEIKRVLKFNGECYLTFGSKSAWGWQQAWPMVDDNTKLRMEEGPEYKVPHFYADKELLLELFSDFEIIGLTHVEDWGNNNRGVHYHVLVRGRDGSINSNDK